MKTPVKCYTNKVSRYSDWVVTKSTESVTEMFWCKLFQFCKHYFEIYLFIQIVLEILWLPKLYGSRWIFQFWWTSHLSFILIPGGWGWRKGGILCSGVLRYRKTWTLLKPKFYGDKLKDWTFSACFFPSTACERFWILAFEKHYSYAV